MLTNVRDDWAVIVPVKSVRDAKTRLGSVYGELRPQLALAFAVDTVAAVIDARRVDEIVVVTSDPAVIEAIDWRARFVADPGGGMNAAIVSGVAAVANTKPAAVLTSDLPALRGADLDISLDEASCLRSAVVGDADGEGTTLLASSQAQRLRPAFGVGSYDRHRLRGAVPITASASPRLRRDVDVPEQLRQALELGVGPATADLLARHTAP